MKQAVPIRIYRFLLEAKSCEKIFSFSLFLEFALLQCRIFDLLLS